MSETYNLYNLEAPFEEYLVAGNQKAVSIKNYRSDARHFFGWLILYFKSHKIKIESEAAITQFITAKVISEYRSYLSENNIPHKTINRRLSTIRKFCSFCISQGWMKENPAKQVLNISPSSIIHDLSSSSKAIESPKISLISKIKHQISKLHFKNQKEKSTQSSIIHDPSSNFGFQYYIGLIIVLIFVAVMGAGIYNQFFVTNNQSLAYPTALTKAGRILSFQGRLTDTLSNPITTATNVQFRLWKVASGGTEGTCTSLGGEDCLYKTGTCSVTPDQDGIFSTLIGSDCGSEIAASVFTENPNVYLGITVGGDAEMTPRQQIANVGYAINSETLQGFPPGTATSTIPYINSDGNLLISAASPGIRSTSTSTDFTLSSAKATVIQSAGTGDVILQATESGTLIFRTGGDTGANTRMTITNSGNVGIGTINPAATALLDLTSTTQGFLAPRMTTTERDAIVSPATGLMIYNTTTNQYNVFNGTVWGAVGGGGGAWSSLTDPVANLSLGMTDYTSTFTYNATTGANNLFNLTDTLNNTGTGYLLNVTTASGSTLKPFHVSAAGNEALTVIANGNVGIGNAAPGTALDVTGTGRFSSGLTLTTGALNLTGTSGALSLSGLSASSINTGANNITFTSGNFNTTATGINGTAIGATTPSTGAFTTLSSSGNTTLGDASGDTVTANAAAWTFANDTNFALSGGVNGLSFDTNTLSIDALNNLVGIGTNAPMAKLDVEGDLNVSTYATVGASLAVGYPAAPAGPGNAIFSGNVGIGINTPASTAILDLTSTTKGFLAPRMTTTERDAIVSPATGLMIYNTTTNQYNVFNGTVWGAVGGGGSGAWSSLTDPTANLTLNMADYTSTFTYNATTGANNLFNLTDTLNNTGTGYLLNVTTASGSTLKPFHVSAAGNEALTVLANGNVGVGNTAPGSLFSVGSGDPFQIDGSGNTSLDNQADIRFYEANANGSNYTGFQAPSSISADVLYTLPNADGLLGQVLQTNGTGGLSWLDIDTNPNAGPWSVNNGAIYPDNSTLDLFIGGTASSSADFAFINVDSGTPAASISGNLALAAPSGANPAGTLSIFNGGSLNFQTSVGGDVGLLSRLFITNSGNLGIGTTSPTQKLTIQQDNVADILGIKDGANNTNLLLADGGVTTFKPTAFDMVQTCSGASCVSADTGSFTNNTTEAKSNAGTPYIMLPAAAPGSGAFYMGLDHKFGTINIDVVTANVGMSTMLVEYWDGAAWTSVSPTDNTTRLTVDGTITFNAPSDWTANSINGTSKYYVRLRNSVGTISTAPTAYFSTPTTGSRFYVYGQSGDTNAALYIADSGNVGLGTNNPQARLDIGGSTSTITNTSGDITIDAASNNISFAGDTLTNFVQALGGSGTVSAPTYSFSSSTNTGIYLASVNVLRFTTNGSDRMTIDATGNVGIGTTSPSYKLDVAGAAGANYFVDNDNANYGLDPAGTGNFGGYSLKTSGGALLAYDTGKVGIGNQTPVGKLDVSGFVTGKALTILNETGNQALLTASASGVTKFTVNHDGSITLAGQTSAPSTLNGGPLVSGTIYYSNTTITGGLTGVTAPSNTGATTGDLFLYGEDSAWHRIALDMTQYSSSAANIENTSYIEIAHNQNTFDISLTGWVKDIVTNLWKRISDFTATIKRALDNEFNPEFTQKQKVTSVALKPNIGNLGTGADGAITVNGTTNINTQNTIAGRSCADGGDAVNYSVSSLAGDGLSTTLTTSPSTPTCLTVGDEVLIINLEGSWASTNPNLGNWETLRVSSVVGPVVSFTTAKTKYYGAGASDDSGIGTTNGTQRVMLQRVPNYTNVTLGAAGNFSPSAFNSVKGGVMFFRATGTVSIAGGGILHAVATGWQGGTPYGTWYGGQGGESWCAGNVYSNSAGAMGGHYTTAGYTGQLCGGGGGGGSRGYNSGYLDLGGSAAVGSYGGAGGGGGGTYSGHSSYHGFGGGGGGGGGLGSAGAGGAGYAAGGAGAAGGTSGAGGNSCASCDAHARGGGGGGGGRLTFNGITSDTGATKLIFGSGGAAGGGGELNQGYYAGGNGGAGGGIVYIAANTITVSGTNGISAYGGAGAAGGGGYGGGGGGGAGGTIKLVGATLNLGSGAFTAVNANGAGGGSSTYSGGSGGSGRVGFYNSTASVASGATSPTAVYDSTVNGYNPYKVYTSKEIRTPGVSAFGNISWNEVLPSGTEVQIQTRTGATANSTDGSWEAWKPTSTSFTISDANTHTDWPGTNATNAENNDSTTTRNIPYFEDEDESTTTNTTKVTATAANGYVERTIGATDLSTYRYITAWVRSAVAGQTITLGFGEAAATERTKTFKINDENTWQKLYWDISADCTPSTNCNAVTKFRFTTSVNGNVFYIDNVNAQSYLTTYTGDTITSARNSYIQYRAILSTTSQWVTPSVSNVKITFSSDPTIYDLVINQNAVDDYDLDNRLVINEVNLDSYKSVNTLATLNGVLQKGSFDPGTGADGAITINGTTNINTQNTIAGRSCADGGDAVKYSVDSFAPDGTYVNLTSSPSTPTCLAVGDEILLINLAGTWTSTNPNLGNWETLRIQNIAGNRITFTNAKTKYYGSGNNDDSGIGTTNGTQRVMLQRVPNYTNVTVTNSGNFSPSAFNSATGGVMFFRATGTVAVAGGGILHAVGTGWRGGQMYSTWYGGNGGESFCAGPDYSNSAGAMGGHYTTVGYSNNLCGGGAGGGARGYNSGYLDLGGSAGVGSYGGAGGGGGATYSGHSSYHGFGGGGGGGGGLGGAGAGGGGYATGGSGATGGQSGSGGSSCASCDAHARGGGGGGGGRLILNGLSSDTGATKLIFGSGGAGGGYGELNQGAYVGGAGGAGGGIVYISAKIITVSGTSGISAYGGGGGSTEGYGGGGGGGAGGTIKLVGDTLNLGNGSFVAVNANGGGGGSSTYYGGSGGQGRIGFYNSTGVVSPSSTSPAAGYDDSMNTNTYSLFVSDEIHTPNATTFNKIKWLANLNTYGNVELQTRSGATPNSTDNTWEPWTPATSSANLVGLDDANTHTNWLATNGTANEGSTALAIPSNVWTKVDNSVPAASDTTGTNGRIPIASTAGRGDITHTGTGAILKDGSTYKMWYGGLNGGWRGYYATSSDGLTWTKNDNTLPANSDTTGTNGRIPFGSTAGRGDVGNAEPTSVIKDGATYKMWYSGTDAGGVWRIFYATSPDGLTWTKLDNTILAASDTTGTNGRIPLGTAGKGDSGGTHNPYVIKDGSTYKMWYTGLNGTWKIYYATSTDGLTWTKYDNTLPADSNSVGTNGRIPIGTAGSGDVGGILGPSIIKDGSTYKMWYSGNNGSNWRIFYATSPDGINWAKFDNTTPLSTSDTTSTNGKIFLGSAGKIDTTHAYYTAVLNDNGTYRIWYMANDGAGVWRVAYATMPNISTPTSPARNVNYFEDEDESDTTKFTLLSSDVTGGYAEATTSSANLANHDYIALWAMTGEAGNTIKVGFGESSSTEHEQTFNIAARDVWQKIYWDISKMPDNERDAVKYLRITNTGSGTNYIYFDNINANRFMTDPDGSIIRSTPNEYIQYRALITTSKPGFFATLHNVQLEWNNGYKIEQTDANKVRLYNYTGEEQELRLDAIVFGADLAEWYTVNDLTVEAGDVVAMTGQLDDYGVPILKKADETNEKHLAGIISTKAGQTLGLEAADRRLLALAGRVPVKIATDSAPIKFGDLLTSSDTPGYAKKAGIGQQTVGKALESWANNMDKKTILALVGNSIAGPDVGAIQDITKVEITKVVNEFGSTTYQLVNDAGETIQSTAAYSKAVISNIQAGIINSVEVVSESITATQKITSPIADIGTLNVSEKIRSPIVETTDLVASGTAKINEIKPVDRDLVINLDDSSSIMDNGNESSQSSIINDPTSFNKGELARIIIKGLQGKTVTTIDSEGNASFAGQIIADSLTINNDATVSGNFTSNTLTVNDATVSGKLIAKEIESESIDQITDQLTNQVTNINDIQKLLADIKNQPIPNLTNETNLTNASNLESLTVTGNSNLYNVSVSNSLLVGTTLVDQNSIISLASELKLSALSTINLFDGAVVIARDGKITTSGEIIAKGGIRTNEIRPLAENDQVEINNLITNNIAIADKYLEATTSASIIAAADNFDLNGIFAPAIETATASAGIAILPESSNEVIIYNNYVKDDSLIYLTPTSLSSPVSLTVGKKENCSTSEVGTICKKYFTVVTNTPSTLPVKFNWLIIN